LVYDLTNVLNSSQSQRVTDVVLKAFRACAASQGDCNNLTFGFGGNVKGSDEKPGFGYYETIAGGSGAGPTWNGAHGVHTHMTNTRITDAEVFERRYPIILREFSLRKNSGGIGQHPGGDGVVRDIEFRIPVQVSILSERRAFRPYGLEGGEDAMAGVNIWVKPKEILNENAEDAEESTDIEAYRYISLGGKNTASMKAGERIIVMTPGGGGWGKPGDASLAQKKIDHKIAWKKGTIATQQETAETSF
jgi:5-oxoprolinase (ATP-hydrolysing)